MGCETIRTSFLFSSKYSMQISNFHDSSLIFINSVIVKIIQKVRSKVRDWLYDEKYIIQ